MQYNAYTGYHPNYFQNIPQQTNAPYGQPSGGNNSIIWVQGEAAAKAYPVAAGTAVLLMDSEGSTMYIKSTDQSGMPQPLRIFDYTERTPRQPEDKSGTNRGHSEDYISRQEFEEFKEEIKRNIKGIRKAEIDLGEEAEG